MSSSNEWICWGHTRYSTTHVEMLHSVSDADEVRVVTKHTGTPNPINGICHHQTQDYTNIQTNVMPGRMNAH